MPTSVQAASLIRGRMHADMVSTEHSADRIEKLVMTRLRQLAQGFPHLVGEPRAKGFAFAFGYIKALLAAVNAEA